MNKIKNIRLPKSPANVSILLFIALAVITIVLQPSTASLEWVNLKSSAAMTFVFAALAETFVLLVGGIDLSIAGIISLTNSFSALYLLDNPLSIVMVTVICVLMGLGIGLLNGFIVQKFKIQPFIVTFSTWFICGGIAYLILPRDGGKPPQAFKDALTMDIGGQVNIALIIIIGLALLWLWFKKTKMGINLYAVGGNEKAAGLNGVNVTKVKLFAYGMAGLLAALAGWYRTGVTGAGSPTAGESFFNQAIGAAVIGGTVLAGGKGGMIGTIFGVFVLRMISDLLVFAGISSYWSTLVQGLLLILAVLIASVAELAKERKELRA